VRPARGAGNAWVESLLPLFQVFFASVVGLFFFFVVNMNVYAYLTYRLSVTIGKKFLKCVCVCMYIKMYMYMCMYLLCIHAHVCVHVCLCL